jgi:ubiquinone/menaquinone biosynthesis C-methylase UbiE
LNTILNYGNWIRKKKIYAFLGMGVCLLLLAIIPLHLIIRTILIISSVIFIGLGFYLAYITYQLSAKGGGYQEKLWQAVLEYLFWDGNGRALDIGTGNGPLAIQIAKIYQKAQVTGIDYWGNDWEYSQSICEENAAIEQVSNRTEFKRASASNLPFEDEHFDAVVSHFVFHEVADTPNKRDVINEALRVLKKGGSFSFQDMFLNEKLYGKTDNLVETIQNWGVQEVQFLDSHKILPIPAPLNTSRVLGYCSILYGKK